MIPIWGHFCADLARCLQAFVCVGGRHADVYDRDVGLLGIDEREQLLGVCG